MKRMMLLLMLLLGCVALLAGCGAPAVGDAEAADIPFDVEIKEKMFISQTNDILVNTDDYLGKDIKMEGMFFAMPYEPTNSMFYMVARYGPGCCGDDGFVGLEVAWVDDAAQEANMPSEEDWVEAIGTLEEYEELGSSYLRLNLKSLRVLTKRGAETVTQ